MSIGDQLFMICLCAGLIFMFFGLPLWILWAGIRRKRAVRCVIGTAWLATSFALVAMVVYFFGPWHEAILDHGQTPDGREYVLMQVCTGEPYSIKLFVRNARGDWVFHYIDHEAWPLRNGARLEFRGKDAVRVMCDGIPYASHNMRDEYIKIEPPEYENSPVRHSATSSYLEVFALESDRKIALPESSK